MNIAIVGGGTAGWISAFYIAKAQPGVHKITVIESSKIGIIGTGEGSTGTLVDLLTGHYFDYKIPIEKFLQETDSTIKMGIRHENWSPDIASYFAPLDFTPTAFTLDDMIFKYVLQRYGNKNIHLASKIGIEYENSIHDTPYALHFDGHKVGKFFKDICTTEDNVKLIDAEIVKVNTDTSGIQQLSLSTGELIEADLYIDCTGFARILMKNLDVEWVDRSDVLPVNTAMPFQVPYSKGENIIPETKATALSAGWMWNIPLTTRRGCGYVFDKKFITREDAQREVETYLQTKIKPIKWIEFTSGYSDVFWKNNTICLGLSSAFVEPLEATSIHNTIIQVGLFVNQFLNKDKEDTITDVHQELYNERIKFLNELTIDFISLHYQGGRTDTPFWRNIKQNNICTPHSERFLNLAKNTIPGMTALEGMYGSFSVPLINWILSGMNILDKDIANKDLHKTGKYHIARNMYQQFYKEVISRQF